MMKTFYGNQKYSFFTHLCSTSIGKTYVRASSLPC